jgi:hypothetical protein
MEPVFYSTWQDILARKKRKIGSAALRWGGRREGGRKGGGEEGREEGREGGKGKEKGREGRRE